MTMEHLGTSWDIPIGTPMKNVVEMIDERFCKLELYIRQLEKEIQMLKGPEIIIDSQSRTLEPL